MGVGGLPCLDAELSVAEGYGERLVNINGVCWCDNACFFGVVRAERITQSFEIIVAYLGECARQVFVAYKDGVILKEGAGAEDMVGMDMGQDNVGDGLV